jgi:uncharacterized protein (TIGR02217 family)
MSNAVFPDLPGLKWSTTKTPLWKTRVQQSVSGKELRTALMSFPLWRYSLAYEVLRAEAAYQELQTLIGFFNARRGSWDDFLYRDPDDNAVTAQQFGVGDGATKDFQLTRPFGGFVEPVQNVNGTPSIYKGGLLQATPVDYSLSATGLVSFVAAPANGVALSWTGGYYQRCRFEQDTAEFTQFLKDLWEARRIEFRTVKL